MAYVHELSGSKSKSNESWSNQINEQASAPISSFAEKQLEKMGWNRGEGLGKRNQGRATHVKVSTKVSSRGVGHDTSSQAKKEEEQQWWLNDMTSVLSQLGSKQDNDKKKPLLTDNDLFAATGGVRFGMRAQSRRQQNRKKQQSSKETAKWKRCHDISKQEEKRAQNNIEWNGRGKAQIISSSSLTPTNNNINLQHSTTTNNKDDDDEKNLNDTNLDEDKTTVKKKKETTDESKEKKKKKKEDKKRKKKKKRKHDDDDANGDESSKKKKKKRKQSQ